MKKSIILFFILIGIASQAQVKKWTLKECVEYALENNISVKQSELDVELTDVEKLTAIGNFLPSVNANTSASKNTGLSFNPVTNFAQTTTFLSATGRINVGYTLFDGLKNFRQVQRAKMSNLSAQFRLTKMKDDISLLVANNYLQVILNKANLEVLKSQNAVTLEQLQRTRDLIDAGVLPEGDALEIKATDANERQNIVIAENNIQVSLISLAQLLLIKDYKTFDIADEGYNIVDESIVDKTVYDIIDGAKENRAEIKIAEKTWNWQKKIFKLREETIIPLCPLFLGMIRDIQMQYHLHKL